jgi:AcrR family transcriptional regulator
VSQAQAALIEAPEPVLYDPALPIHHFPGQAKAAPSRRNQRLRRAQILATIRRLLTEEGFEGVTVRRIAQASGHAVQTIYNLVGPRDRAIVEAISEYTRYVGRTASPSPEDPQAVMAIIDCWLRSVEAAPAFCRQVSMIHFGSAREVFYSFRDRELKGMQGLLSRQQKCGAIRPEANVRDLAEQLVLLASALCVEWSDRPFPVEQLRRRLYSGYANLLAGAVAQRGPRAVGN